MRMFAQDGAFYRRIRVDETDDAEARRRLRIVEGIEEMRERFPAEAACRAFGVSRATCYEWRRRLKEGGVSGLAPRSSRPLRHAGRQWTMDDAARELRCGVSRAHDRLVDGRAVACRANRGGAVHGPSNKDLSGRHPKGEKACHGCYGRPHGCLTSSCLEGR